MNPVHDPGLDLNLLKVFDALLQTRSVTRAAGLLGVSQSAVSHALRRLRSSTGDVLFVRTGAAMQPTARAERLGETVREALLAAARVLSAQESFDPASDERVFAIGASDSIQVVVLARLLAELAAAGPRVALRLRSLDRDALLAALDQGELDLAVGYLPVVRRWHERQELFQERHLCLFNPELLPLSQPLTVEEFAAHGHLVPSLRGELSSFVDVALEQRGLRRRVVASTAQFLAIPMLLKVAPLIATLPAGLARYCAHAALLATGELPFDLPGYGVSMVWHRRDNASPALGWLRERISCGLPR